MRHWLLVFFAAIALGAVPSPADTAGAVTKKPAAQKAAAKKLPVQKKPPAKKKLPAKKKPVVVDRRSIQGLQPPCARCMTQVLAGFKKAGVIYSISSVKRTYADQMRLWRRRYRNRYPVARPGTSMHELGLAIDLTFTKRGAAGRAVMRRYGFSQPVRHDPVHWECRHSAQKKATGC